MTDFLKRLLRSPGIIFLLSLGTLTCLPVALSGVVRDAANTLLLPIIFFGFSISSGLALVNVRKSLAAMALLCLGPLAVCIRVGRMGGALFEFLKQTFNVIIDLIGWMLYRTPFDISAFLAADTDFVQRVDAMGARLSFWFMGFWKGVTIEDPVVRTLTWSLILWLIAAWAGWQIYSKKHFLIGMLPSTVLLVFILDYLGGKMEILWLYLPLLLFLYGFTNYTDLQERWNGSHLDYYDGIDLDTLVVTGFLALSLVSVSYFSSTLSLKDILDHFREQSASSSSTTETQAQPLGPEATKHISIYSETGGGLPRAHLIGSGPELSHQLVMTISTDDLPAMSQNVQSVAPRYYWRTLTYSIYTGLGWSNPSLPIENISADQPLIKAVGSKYRLVHQEVTFPGNSGGRLYWAGRLVQVNAPIQAVWIHGTGLAPSAIPNSDSDLMTALASVGSYHVESAVLNVSVQELRDSPSIYPAWVQNQYLALPDSVPERVRALARDLTASEITPYGRALAIQNYLRKFPYTLDVPAPPRGRDVADYFLFDLKRGYCDYYATTMIVLARAAGLPARLVIGYANGSYDPKRAEYIVTENYAHSWVEIYFANIGWVEFEPTASEPAIVYSGTGLTSAPVEATTPKHSWGSWLGPVFSFTYKKLWIPVTLLFIFSFLWLGFDALRLTLLEPSHAIRLLYIRLHRLARPVSGPAAKSQTARMYAHILVTRLSLLAIPSRLKIWISPSYSEIDRLTEIYSRSLFAPVHPDHAEARNALLVWSRLRWRLVLANVFAWRR